MSETAYLSGRMTTRNSIKSGLRAFGVTAAAVFLIGACMFEPESRGPGFVKLQLDLRENGRVLQKSSASDTTFSLDSLIIILSASGETDKRYSYPISGRPDTGSIVVSPKVYELDPLLNWTATILTIDTTLLPVP